MTETPFENGERVIERWDRVFEALSEDPRRQLLVTLLDAGPDESVPLPESAVNPNVPKNPETLRIELYHSHLPALADQGFVEWERKPFVASRGPRFEEAAIVVEALHAFASELPDSLVIGCRRLEQERQFSSSK